jgi:tRNA-guanine transglycosylase
MSSFFNVLHNSKRSKARLGEINTAHGTIKTPAFVPVATKGTIKSLPPQLVANLHLQVCFVNTYHIVVHPGAEVLERAGGIQKFSQIHLPFMSDSGGFQVFSLDKNKRAANFFSEPENEIVGSLAMPTEQKEALILKISDEGVSFRSIYDGTVIEFTPESSMKYQQQIGADLLMAFDECTYYPATHEYAVKAMNRTHEWLKRCIAYIKEHKTSLGHPQYLYGIIQGGTYEDLRKQSAEFVLNQDVPGIAIGGVAVGESKKEIREQVAWVSPYLPKDKPVHLLGIGHIDDIYDLIVHGIDSFDCVEPTRLGRIGVIYKYGNAAGHFQKNIKREITKSIYKNDLSPVDEDCDCYVCTNFTKAYLHHLFKQKELLGYTLATYHNLYVMEKFMEIIREQIARDEI